MLLEQGFIWVDAVASMVIFLAVLKLYELNRLNLYLGGRIFLASIAASAIYSTLEILAWRRPIPVGMSLFLVLLSLGWALRAFAPCMMMRLFPPGTGMTGAAAAAAQARRNGGPTFAIRN